MNFTELFIRRPVLASVVSLMIMILGLRSIASLEVRQFPKTENTVVTVTTLYPGASSELVQGFITTPLQQAIAEADGIDYLTSSSRQGISEVKAHMELNYPANDALAEIQAKVASRRGDLPQDAEDPIIDSTTGESLSLMYLAFYSDTMNPSQITDYLIRVAQPKLLAIAGVGAANVIGNRIFAMRLWLDPRRMTALGVTADDVRRVLQANNYLAGVGETKGSYVSIDLGATTDISRVDDFENLVIRSDEDTLIRISDIAETELGAENYDTVSWYKDKIAVYVGINPTPGANPLDVALRVRETIKEIETQLPTGLGIIVPYDASIYIQDSIKEVFTTLAEAIGIVLLMIYLSLGSLRAALIPALAVPLSLIGAAFLMLMMGFSINLLTLLAMVLAIGLVVDDAIVVVENVHRHIELGKTPLAAAIVGARELGLPIIAMTTTLVAVFSPFLFMGGLVGTLFSEFAFALAGAVLISGVVALTLSPMLSSKVLHSSRASGRFEQTVEHLFSGLANAYHRTLCGTLKYQPVTLLFGLAILASCYFFWVTSASEDAPTEDQSTLMFQARGPQNATIDYTAAYGRQILEVFQSIPEYHASFFLLGMGSPNIMFGGFRMLPPSERERSQSDVQAELQPKLSRVAGLQIGVFTRSSLPGAPTGFPIEFVIATDSDYSQLDQIADDMIGRAMQSGRFQFLRKSIEFSLPRTNVVIDRDRAGILGIEMEDIGRNLSTLVGEGYVNRFNLQGRSYKVIPQVAREFRLDAEMLARYYVRSGSGDLVPLATIIDFERTVEPSDRTQFQQLNALTIEGVPASGVALGDALEWLAEDARQHFPQGYASDYMGRSRQLVAEGTSLIIALVMAVIVIYLVLAAQFESWRDPIIILVSVPLSFAGALAFVTLGFATLNIYTKVGLVTLIGLVAKNGILIVQFANQLQATQGLSKREAVAEAAKIRLRPILMTTGAMILAMVPLLFASGAGAVSRFHIGLVIATGLGIGTLFTLFVVPAVYLLMARDHGTTTIESEDPETIAFEART